jgi:hypothetical protein
MFRNVLSDEDDIFGANLSTTISARSRHTGSVAECKMERK